MRISPIAWIAIVLLTIAAATPALDLSNGIIRLDLQVHENGTPFIAACVWEKDGDAIFQNTSNAEDNLNAWIQKSLAKKKIDAQWKTVPHPLFVRAEADAMLKQDIRITWIVELVPDTAMIRMHVRMENTGDKPQRIDSFPIAMGTWKALGGITNVRYWEALTFQRRDAELLSKKELALGSAIHSSDQCPTGQNPYWIWMGQNGRLFFGLEWCGGWQARMRPQGNAVHFRAWLPDTETQLTLNPGEKIDGPVLIVTATHETDDLGSRSAWMKQRNTLRKALYGGPEPYYPFSYNNWYTTRFNVDAAFLERQLATMDPYRFDLFVVDAGWYKAVGQWEPDPAKFAPGQFESILKNIKNKGVKIGIWSCPQFVHASPDALPQNVDSPPFYRKFIDGYLLDYAGMDFTNFLLDHAANLKNRYYADWWKYDQDFFVQNSRHGRMKNVVALQSALMAVRKAYPDWYLENCQSGGRMLNEFTVLSTQNQWIRDGGKTGPDHARAIGQEALGALEFLPPWTVNRWTNNPDQNPADDDAFTKFYCRSAMPGTWGLVADCAKISDRQRNIICKEADNYRRFNNIKSDCRYEILPPKKDAPLAGIIYYDDAGQHAAALLLRWDAKGPLEFPIQLPHLQADATYRIQDVDDPETKEAPGTTLRKTGYTIAFPQNRTSALLFFDRQ